MKLCWLGQSGLMIVFNNGRTMYIDPYLSDYIADNENPSLKRLLPVRCDFLNRKIDYLLLSHSHTDHMDPATLSALFANPQNKDVTIVSSRDVWAAIRGKVPNAANSFVFPHGTQISLCDEVRITSIFAVHSDTDAVSFLIEADGQRIYISADTLFHPRIVQELKGRVDLAILCINGAGNNMNPADAARLAIEIEAKVAVPVHWDLLPGYTEDPAKFTALLRGTSVKASVLTEYDEYEIKDLLEV